MNLQIDRDRVINKFKRNGHMLNKGSLQIVLNHLREIDNANKQLQEIIKKINEMTIMSQQQFNQNSLKLAIDLLKHKTEQGKTFSRYDQFLEHIKKWTIITISPYQAPQKLFVDKPDPILFKFQSQQFLKMNRARFRAISQYNSKNFKKLEGHTFIGILYQKFVGQGRKLMLQNQINQVELIFSPNFILDCFLIPGFVYIATGQIKTKDVQLQVKTINLPMPLQKPQSNLIDVKLKVVCDNISYSKSGLDFKQQDFKSYEIIYNKAQDKKKPILIFGNFKICLQQASKVNQIIKKYPITIECIILMMSDDTHQQIDLKKQISNVVPIYLIPHINSEGPRILPKLPILKHDYNVKVMTNPARFSIQGKQCIFINYPLIQNLYSRSVLSKQSIKFSSRQIGRKIADFMFSQNNLAVTNKFFWNQSQYLSVNSQSIIFVADKSCAQQYLPKQQIAGKGFVNVGNFLSGNDFVFFRPHSNKQIIQLSQIPQSRMQ